MNTVVTYRDTQRFIRGRKSRKNDQFPKMTRDKKSHKKSNKDRVDMRVKETIDKNNDGKILEQEQEYSIPEPKCVKILTQNKTKKLPPLNSNNNLIACWEDTELAEYDVIMDIEDMEWDNVLAGYSASIKKREEEERRRNEDYKFELLSNDDLSPIEVCRLQKYCQLYENKMELKKDRRLTLDEYEAKRKEDDRVWLAFKKFGLSRQKFEAAREYEVNCETLRLSLLDCLSYDHEYVAELKEKIQAYEDNLEEEFRKEEEKLNEWFANVEENNEDLLRKIREKSCFMDAV